MAVTPPPTTPATAARHVRALASAAGLDLSPIDDVTALAVTAAGELWCKVTGARTLASTGRTNPELQVLATILLAAAGHRYPTSSTPVPGVPVRGGPVRPGPEPDMASMPARVSELAGPVIALVDDIIERLAACDADVPAVLRVVAAVLAGGGDPRFEAVAAALRAQLPR